MSEEIKTGAVELTDEEIENAIGGKKRTCEIHAYTVSHPGIHTVGQSFCESGCPYSSSGVCVDGRISVSNDKVDREFSEWSAQFSH